MVRTLSSKTLLVGVLVAAIVAAVIIAIVRTGRNTDASRQQFVTELLHKAAIRINGPRAADIRVRHPNFYRRLVVDGSLGLCESYMDGEWDSRDLEATCRTLSIHEPELKRHLSWNWTAFSNLLRDRVFNMQTLAKSTHNVQAHYDIGNALYENMLDPRYMQYTCALYDRPNLSLQAAQIRKLHLICKKLNLRPGMSVLDIGCGFGGLAFFMAREYGASVFAVNISKEQLKFARRRYAHPRIQFVEMDYRNIPTTLRVDCVVSVGVMEHIGTKNYQDYFRIAHQALKPNGLALIHTIGTYAPPGNTAVFIDKYIFPGGYIPRFQDLSAVITTTGFHLEDWHNFGKSYARTLREWHANINRAWMRLDGRRFNRRFQRMWNLYLLGCAAAFDTCGLSLWQVVLTKSCPRRNPRRAC